MAKRLLLCILLLFSLRLMAQTDVQLSQHMFNRINYNPAVTGASRYINVTGSSRDQWVGWEGAPSSIMVTAHSFFNTVNSGFGLTLLNDKIGYEKSLNIKLSYAYHVQLGESSYLSLGLGAGILQRGFDYDKISTEDDSDHEFELLGLKEKIVPDFDFGVEFNSGKFTFGLSVTHLTQEKEQESDIIAGRHYYLFAKQVIPLNHRWRLVPSLFMQSNRKSVHGEVNILTSLDERYWMGFSLRMNDRFKTESFVPIVGVNITEYVRVGYSYDVNLWRLSGYSGGTHEILLSFRIPKKADRYSRSPRFFE